MKQVRYTTLEMCHIPMISAERGMYSDQSMSEASQSKSNVVQTDLIVATAKPKRVPIFLDVVQNL